MANVGRCVCIYWKSLDTQFNYVREKLGNKSIKTSFYGWFHFFLCLFVCLFLNLKIFTKQQIPYNLKIHFRRLWGWNEVRSFTLVLRAATYIPLKNTYILTQSDIYVLFVVCIILVSTQRWNIRRAPLCGPTCPYVWVIINCPRLALRT